MRAGISCSSAIVLPEESLHLGDHGAWLARLCQIPIASDFHCFLAIGRERMGRESDDGNLPSLRIVFEHLRRLPSVDDGNRNVHENQVRLLRSRLGDTLLAVQRLGDRVAEMTQDGGIDDAVILVVFNQQYRLAVRGHESPHTPAQASAMEWDQSGVRWCVMDASAGENRETCRIARKFLTTYGRPHSMSYAGKDSRSRRSASTVATDSPIAARARGRTGARLERQLPITSRGVSR